MGLHRTRKCPNCDNDTLEYDKWVDTLQTVKDRYKCSICGYTELVDS